MDADQFGSAAEDRQPTRSILLHRCARGISRREGHDPVDGGGRMRSRRSRWVLARSHVPIAIATRVVTCSTTPTTSSERFALRTRRWIAELARAVAERRRKAVEVRRRHGPELNQELLIFAKRYWGAARPSPRHTRGQRGGRHLSQDGRSAR